MTVQDTLSVIYADVLGVERVGVEEGFFDAGGDSVLALQVVARAREAGLSLSVRDVFEQQTVALLAAVTTEATETAGVTTPLVELDEDQLAEFEDDVADAEQYENGWETAR